ncbi:uncharacterized protein [Hetaerina americana]|uniref:uncharacterized protein n=1 Tax=Hetaerina americana TaxID=62018 RepID=UPI003A7F2919
MASDLSSIVYTPEMEFELKSIVNELAGIVNTITPTIGFQPVDLNSPRYAAFVAQYSHILYPPSEDSVSGEGPVGTDPQLASSPVSVQAIGKELENLSIGGTVPSKNETPALPASDNSAVEEPDITSVLPKALIKLLYDLIIESKKLSLSADLVTAHLARLLRSLSDLPAEALEECRSGVIQCCDTFNSIVKSICRVMDKFEKQGITIKYISQLPVQLTNIVMLLELIKEVVSG